MKQSVNGSELTYEPQKQTPSQCRTSPEVYAQHNSGKWGRMHERAVSMLEQSTVQMARQEGVTEQMKAVEPMTWVSRINDIRGWAEEIIRENVINSL